MKLAVALAALAGLVSASPPNRIAEPNTDQNAIAMIRCGTSTGTAFWISPNRIVTANHVVTAGPCSIDGVDLQLTGSEPNDIAYLTGLRNSRYLTVRCAEPRRGVYFATGFPMGGPRFTARLSAQNIQDDGARFAAARGFWLFLGRAYPGMSGGPVVDSRGRVVAIVNMGGSMPPATAARALTDTAICRRGE